MKISCRTVILSQRARRLRIPRMFKAPSVERFCVDFGDCHTSDIGLLFAMTYPSEAEASK